MLYVQSPLSLRNVEHQLHERGVDVSHETVGYATMSVTDKINERLEYSTVLAEILRDYGPGSDPAGANSNSEPVDCAANPGNDKCVGNAGEDPNGSGDWGDGSQGMSQ